MYVLYELATGKVVRVSISAVTEPTKAAVLGELDPTLYDGVTLPDDPAVFRDKDRYRVTTDAQGNPVLETQPQIVLSYSGDYQVVDGWRRICPVDQPTAWTLHIRDEQGNPLFLTGTVRLDSPHLLLTDTHVVLDGTQSDIPLTLRGRHPGHTAVEVHLEPTDRPLVRESFRIDVVSLATCRRLSGLPSYALTTDATDTDGAGLPDLPADGATTTILTIQKQHPDGTDDTTATDAVRCTTDRGKLSAETVTLVNGTATVTLTSVPETVTATVRARPVAGAVVWGEVQLHFRP